MIMPSISGGVDSEDKAGLYKGCTIGGIWIVFICNVILLDVIDTSYFCLLDDVRVL